MTFVASQKKEEDGGDHKKGLMVKDLKFARRSLCAGGVNISDQSLDKNGYNFFLFSVFTGRKHKAIRVN